MLDHRLTVIQSLARLLTNVGAGPWILERPPERPETKDFDLAIPCFSLAKTLKKAPVACAEDVKQALTPHFSDLRVSEAKVVNGYLNLKFEIAAFENEFFTQAKNPLARISGELKDDRFVVDFSSPNIAKPFGIGHLRSTNIGASICRILKALGADVIRINHLGDWGTQFGKMITAYKRFGSADFVRGDPVNNLYKLYVEFHEKEKNDPALLDEAREWFVKLEAGDPEATELWKWFKDVSYHEFKRLYTRLGVDFEYVTGESFYNELMVKTVQKLEELKLLKESEGARIVDLEAEGMPPCLIRKSDGSTLYATRDLATAEYRYKTFKPTKLVYVVGSEQTLHFRQVFKVLELMGFAWAKDCVHVGFGLIQFPEGKMSTRKGNIVLLEKVLDQACEEALKIVREKNQERPPERRVSENEELEIAQKVGTGAVIFFDLHAKRTKDVLFDWKSILNFEGDSGPYLQYAYVRLGALLERAKAEGHELQRPEVLKLETQEERDLFRELLHFPQVLVAAGREYEPSIISHQLLQLSAAFNRFYMNVPVMKGDAALLPSRLLLVEATRQTIRTGLDLLGIQCPERM